MKLSDILSTASGNLGQSRLRTGLTITAVFIGALTLSLTNGIGAGISAYVTQQVGALGAKDILVVTPKTDRGGGLSGSGPATYDPSKTTGTGFDGGTVTVLSQKDLTTIGSQAGITSVTPLRLVNIDYVSAGSSKFKIAGNEYLSGTNLPMEAGVLPDNGASALQITLPYTYPDALGFSAQDMVGKTVDLGVTDATGKQTVVQATVVGIQQQTLISASGANLNTALLNKLYDLQSVGLPAATTQKYVEAIARFDTSLNSSQQDDLKNALGAKGYQAQTAEDQLGSIKQVLSTITIVLDFFGAIALVAAAFGVINTLLMAVQERTKEIGLMKAMGMGGGQIFLLFSVEATLLGFWGSVLGILAAIGIGKGVNAYAAGHFLKGLPGLNLLAFPWQTMLLIAVVIMIITFLAGTLPARHASRLNPIEALRYE